MQHSYIDRQKLRTAYRQWIADTNPTAFITLTTNSACSSEQMRTMLKSFFFQLDKHRLGNKLRKKPDQRIDGHIFIEKPECNTHAHGCLVVPLLEIAKLIAPSRFIWEHICETGEVKLDLLCDRAERIKYATKEQQLVRHYDFGAQHILLSEFFPQR
jgi:hypothetical protein